MLQRITLLGATGSIGSSTLEVLRQWPERFCVQALAAGSRLPELIALARRFEPKVVALADASRLDELRAALVSAGLSHIKAMAGEAAMVELARDPETDIVVQAIVGAAGVAPTFAAAKAGKRLLLANKESVVCGGALLMRTIQENGAELLPVDSEHNAIFQCLAGATPQARAGARLILTASGGPFRTRKDLSGITPEMAVAHPKWSMGRKISVDSASLMNKGLEVIEAAWLFGFKGDRIDVVVHPESLIHSMVQFEDGAILAQMGSADMKTPIAYSLGWPERMDGGAKRLDFSTLSKMTFEMPDRQTFPLLDAAYAALAQASGATIVLNAANEIAVEAFLARQIGFTDIFKTVLDMLDMTVLQEPGSLEDILHADQEVRRKTREYLTKTWGKQTS